MAQLMKMLQPLQSEYVDRRFDGTKEEYFEQLELSSTLYIGNLSFYTTEDQIYELFSKVGVVRRVIMGLDRNTKTPCGFCFVIYHTRANALAAVRYLSGTKLDNRQLRVDIDYGFEEGRQFGRGRSGGQVRDEFRTDYDADRGGYGRVVAQQLAAQQLAMWQEVQAGAMLGAGLLPAGAGGAVFFGQDQRVSLQQAGPAGAPAQLGEDAAGAAEAQHSMQEGQHSDVGGVDGRGQQRDEGDEGDGAEQGGEEAEESDDAAEHRAKRRKLDVDGTAGEAAHAGEQQQQEEEDDEEEAGGDGVRAGVDEDEVSLGSEQQDEQQEDEQQGLGADPLSEDEDGGEQ